MTQRKRQLTARIRAIDSDGRAYTIDEHTTYIGVSTLDATGPQWLPGLKQLSVDGEPVNSISETEYEIVRTGLRLSRQG